MAAGLANEIENESRNGGIEARVRHGQGDRVSDLEACAGIRDERQSGSHEAGRFVDAMEETGVCNRAAPSLLAPPVPQATSAQAAPGWTRNQRRNRRDKRAPAAHVSLVVVRSQEPGYLKADIEA